MRVLRFLVDKQLICRDPACDFSGLVPGTRGYLQAEFSFSPEWEGCVKVASFLSLQDKEFPPQVLKDGKTCMIPEEALKYRKFKVKVIGKKGSLRIPTNEVTVNQNGGKV